METQTARSEMRRSTSLLLAGLIVLVDGADPTVPHAHNGILSKYERIHPKHYGVTLQGVSRERLRRSAVCQSASDFQTAPLSTTMPTA